MIAWSFEKRRVFVDFVLFFKHVILQLREQFGCLIVLNFTTLRFLSSSISWSKRMPWTNNLSGIFRYSHLSNWYAYSGFSGFPGNPIKPMCKRYWRLSVGEAHLSRRYYTHPGHKSRRGCHGTHTLKACLSIYLLYLSCLGVIEFQGKP